MLRTPARKRKRGERGGREEEEGNTSREGDISKRMEDFKKNKESRMNSGAGVDGKQFGGDPFNKVWTAIGLTLKQEIELTRLVWEGKGRQSLELQSRSREDSPIFGRGQGSICHF